MVKSLAPILLVDSIEPCLPFWSERLGFQVVAQVPEGDRLGFVILSKNELTVMLQTNQSIENDLTGVQTRPGGCLYLTVDDWPAILDSLAGCEVAVPPRKTFYGADEIWVREPGGNLIGFSFHGVSE